MLEFLQWIIVIVKVVPWIVMGASAVAALTPTPIDDGIVKKDVYSLRLVCIKCRKSKRQIMPVIKVKRGYKINGVSLVSLPHTLNQSRSTR